MRANVLQKASRRVPKRYMDGWWGPFRNARSVQQAVPPGAARLPRQIKPVTIKDSDPPATPHPGVRNKSEGRPKLGRIC